jgi:hypothetical protein
MSVLRDDYERGLVVVVAAELSFSKFKAYLRKFSERTIRTLYRRVGAFVPTLSRAECRNYFRHAGYVSI